MDNNFREGFEKTAIPFTSAGRGAAKSVAKSMKATTKKTGTMVKITKPKTVGVPGPTKPKGFGGLFGPSSVRF